MGEIKQLAKKSVKKYTMFIIMIFIVVFFQIRTGGMILIPQNFSNLVLQNAFVVVLAVGMMICIITGGNVDLSVGSVAGFVGAISGLLIIEQGFSPLLIVGLCVLISLAVGAWHGLWIAYFKVPSFIATLSGMLIFRGLTFYFLRGRTITGYPPEFTFLLTGFLPDFIGGGRSPLHITTLVIGALASVIYIQHEFRKFIRKKNMGVQTESVIFLCIKVLLTLAVVNWAFYTLASHQGIPMVLIPVSIIVIVYSFYMSRTVGGRHIYALGGNEKASRLSGVNVRRTLFFAYVNMAFLACIAGLIFTARLNAATPRAGDGFELQAIAAAFIGGASASGGVGTIVGAVIGALVMGILNNGMSILGFQSDMQLMVTGFVLLFAVVIDILQRK